MRITNPSTATLQNKGLFIMKKICIIGAGYAGLRALEQLAKNPAFHITLIDKNPYHYMQTEAYGYIAGRFDISDIAIDLEGYANGFEENVTFVKQKALSIDPEQKTIQLSDMSLHYDYAVIAVGGMTNFFSFIKGSREFTQGVKNIERAFEFRQAFEKRIYLKLEEKKLNRKGDLHIAIAGAGLSGVEIAAEMAHMLQSYHKILSQKSMQLKISLIDAAGTILPGMDPYIIKNTEKRLRELGVEILTEAFIKEITHREILFQDETTLSFDFVIYTAGIKGALFVQELATEKNRLNQIIPDDYLRLQNYPDIYAIGDCAEIKDQNGDILPPTAQIAEKSAEYVAKNIIRIESKESIQPFHASVDGVFVALGGHYAIGVLFKVIKVKGYSAYMLKKIITRFYRLGLELKVNAGYKKRI